MALNKTSVLINCHSLEDFPVHHTGTGADSLLANWTVAWHPALIATTGKLPGWNQTDALPDAGSGLLLLIPSVSTAHLPSGYLRSAERDGAIVIRDLDNRPALLEQILASGLVDEKYCEDDSSGPARSGNSCVDSFYALGYLYLQIQIMTRQLRGSSNLDEKEFESALIKAARVATDLRTHSDHSTKSQPEPKEHGSTNIEVNDAIRCCFDLLMAEKNNYYPVGAKFLDVVLTTGSVLGPPLLDQLQQTHRHSLLMTADLLTITKLEYADSFNALRHGVETGIVNIVGGLKTELALPLLSIETSVRQIGNATRVIQSELGAELDVFARRRFGMTPELPALLEQFNFAGAMHVSFDGGRFPRASSGNMRWQSTDGSSVLALTSPPREAMDGGTWLRLSLDIGNSIDSAHLATMLLVHWPGQMHFAMQDLIVAHRYGPVFGKFETLSSYFNQVYDPGYGDSFSHADYRGNYLAGDLETKKPDPISRFVDYWQRHYQLQSLRALDVLNKASGCVPSESATDADIRELERQADAATESNTGSLDHLIQTLKTGTAESVFQKLFGKGSRPSVQLLNTTGFPRRVSFSQATNSPSTQRAYKLEKIYAADSIRTSSPDARQLTDWVVDLPAMSSEFVQTETSKTDPLARHPAVVQGDVLQNEFCQLKIDRRTGGIRSLDRFDQRNNLLTQQLALRIGSRTISPSSPGRIAARYSEMVCDSVQAAEGTRICGSITTTGRLIDRGSSGEQSDEVATFRQTVIVTRGRPMVEIEIEIEPAIELPSNAQNYFCNRIAWKDESADLIRSAPELRAHVIEDRFEAPNFIEINNHKDRILLLTGGLPYHRRSSRRMIDSLLITSGESCRRFRIGLALNSQLTALQTAVDFMTPVIVRENAMENPPKQPVSTRDSGSHVTETGNWFFHFNRRNVVVTWWQPRFNPDGQPDGVTIRMQETENRKGELRIEGPRELASASQINLRGEFIRSIDIDGSAATIEFRGSEFFQIQLHWR